MCDGQREGEGSRRRRQGVVCEARTWDRVGFCPARSGDSPQLVRRQGTCHLIIPCWIAGVHETFTMDGGHQKALRAKAAAHYWIDPPPLTVHGAARLVVPARKLSLARCLGALLQAIRAPPRTCGRDGLPAGCPPLPPQNGRMYGCSAGASLSGASDPPSAAPPPPRDTRPSQRPASHRRAAGSVSAISQLARPRIWQPSKQPSSPTESGEPCRRFPLAHRAPCRGAECSAPCRQSRASHQATETHHHPACETMCDMSVGTAVAGHARLLRACHVYGSIARPAKFLW